MISKFIFTAFIALSLVPAAVIAQDEQAPSEPPTLEIPIDIPIEVPEVVELVPPPPDLPPDTPIDGGLSLLVAAGVGYGIKKVRDSRKHAVSK